MLWEAPVAYDCLGTVNGDVGSWFDKWSGVISVVGSLPAHACERGEAQRISMEDRAECRIGASFLGEDFKESCEFNSGFMGELSWIKGPFQLFRT